MKKILIFILNICICFGCSTKEENGHAFKKEKLTGTMYKMLGILDEYISRFNYYTGEPHKNLVERFYPNEKGIAEIFDGLIKQYRKEIKKNYKYYKKIGEQGHIYFYSKRLSKIINSFYVMKGRYATLNIAIFSDADTNSKLAFIEGVYLRYGNENANLIRMANALNKMETIGFVLKSLNCNNVYIYITRGLIPQIVEIIFEPSDSIKKYLKVEKMKSKVYLENKKYRHFYKEIK